MALTWQVLLPILIEHGLPLVEQIVARWNSDAPVTVEDIEALKALSNNTPSGKLKAALAHAGIDENDPRAVALLELVK